MKTLRIYTILSAFTRKELTEFSEFVHSPYFNKNVHVRKLCDTVVKYPPEFNHKNLTPEKLFSSVFPKQKYDYNKISNIISDLFQLSKEFLKLKAVEKAGSQAEIFLLSELNDRKLGSIYEQVEKKLKSSLKNAKVIDEAHYYQVYGLMKENTTYYNYKKPGGDFKIVQNEFDSFLEYSIIALMRLYMYMLHNKNHGNVSFNMDMFDKVLEYIKDKDFEENPLYMIYKQSIMLELYREEKYYYALKELQKKYRNIISQDDYDNIYIFMNAFIAHMINTGGNEKYYREKFELFDGMIKDEAITTDKILYPDFMNIHGAAVTAGEYGWAEKFMKDFSAGIVPESEKQTSLNYCEGFLNYRLKNFEKSLEFLSKTSFQLFFMKIAVKTLTVRIYYEINLPEQGFAVIDSFRHFLRSEKLITGEQKNTYYQFLKCLGLLFNLRMNGKTQKDAFEFLDLEKQIEEIETNMFGVKVWMRRKLKELG